MKTKTIIKIFDYWYPRILLTLLSLVPLACTANAYKYYIEEKYIGTIREILLTILFIILITIIAKNLKNYVRR